MEAQPLLMCEDVVIENQRMSLVNLIDHINLLNVPGGIGNLTVFVRFESDEHLPQSFTLSIVSPSGREIADGFCHLVRNTETEVNAFITVPDFRVFEFGDHRVLIRILDGDVVAERLLSVRRKELPGRLARMEPGE